MAVCSVRNKEIIKFIIVGVINTAVDFTVFNILSFFSVDISLSKVISYASGALNSFLFNKYWTFRVRNTNIKKEAAAFIFVNLISLVLNALLIKKIYILLAAFDMLSEFLRKNITNLIVICLTLVINYLGIKLLVFKENKKECRH